MTSKPILFSGAMVRAILAGTKTQTRRVVKPQPAEVRDATAHVAAFIDRVPFLDRGRVVGTEDKVRLCPYGAPGGKLWVREGIPE